MLLSCFLGMPWAAVSKSVWMPRRRRRSKNYHRQGSCGWGAKHPIGGTICCGTCGWNQWFCLCHFSLSLYIQDRSLRSWSRSARDFTAIDLAMNPSHPDRSRRSYLGLNRAGSTPLATKHSAALPGLWPAASLELWSRWVKQACATCIVPRRELAKEELRWVKLKVLGRSLGSLYLFGVLSFGFSCSCSL